MHTWGHRPGTPLIRNPEECSLDRVLTINWTLMGGLQRITWYKSIHNGRHYCNEILHLTFTCSIFLTLWEVMVRIIYVHAPQHRWWDQTIIAACTEWFFVHINLLALECKLSTTLYVQITRNVITCTFIYCMTIEHCTIHIYALCSYHAIKDLDCKIL